MAASQEPVVKQKKNDISQMLRLARISANEGDPVSANQLLQRAALLEPANEEVWLTLLQVVDTVEDRRACLLNILAINPGNEAARQQLEQLDDAAMAVPSEDMEPQQKPLAYSLVDILLWVIEILVILLLIGLAIVLIAYA